MAAGDEQILTRLADVQRHVTLKMGQSRLARMVEGIDRGAWLRVRLDDGSVVQGMLQSVEGNVLGLQRPKADGTLEGVEVAEEKVIELDGLLRSTSTRLILNDLAAGEPIALMMWPEAREVVGVLKARTDLLLTVDTGEGGVVTVPVEGPVAEARRVPAKWRNIVASFSTKTTAHARSAEDFADARVERDLIGTVSALTAYALVLDTPDGVLVLPWDTLTQVSGTDTTSEAALAKPMKKSERAYRIPVKPGDPADKAKEADAESGVSVVTDGSRVKNVLVSAPYDGDVFGISLGDRVDDAEDRTDIRFDTIVTQRRSGVLDGKPSELISNSLEHVRVTLLLDSSGSVSAIELGAR
jgi:hypothetical protein